MILFVVLTCCIGIAAGAAVATAAGDVEDDDDDEIESLAVLEGGNLTISIHIEKWDENPQILLFRRKESSKELIAQIICHNGDCEQKWRSEVSLKSDGENVSLSLINVNYNQTGVYEVRKPSSKWHGNKIYNVSVHQPPLSTINPEKTSSAKYSDSTAGISVGAVGVVLVVLALVVIIGAVIYSKRKRAQESDPEASRRHRSQRDVERYL
ncbi:uncharacterized protein si:rp71-80o10.4 [Labeo rohita]|uniref:uncharacterized protein si:rp71-80o10.4 n=1 Tax=Labeo rohita TaxID=84645 RepID=UPI0021E22F57|nr:uncharacterized protein si:rp71-80o10.4 [Labeo rohita]